MEEKIRHWSDYALTLGKWLLFSLVVGVTVGVVGAVFHLAISYVTELRGQHGWILYLLPLAGLVVVLMMMVRQISELFELIRTLFGF